MIAPLRLRPGDTVGIAAPCSTINPDSVARGTEKLRSLGLRVVHAPNLRLETYGYAASPEERAADFNLLVRDPEVRMIFFGGGDVGNEILPLLDYEAIARDPKLYLSFSDGTSLLNPIAWRCGIQTFYGQTPRTLADSLPYNVDWFTATFLQEGIPAYKKAAPWNPLHGGQSTGTLVGGYLGIFSAMLHSPYMPLPQDRDYILFLEDHVWFSSPAQVSRWLAHLSQSGFMQRVKGLIIGHYSTNPEDDVLPVWQRFADQWKIPVVKTDDFGHGENGAIFPIGASAHLDADSQTLEFLSHSTI